MKRTGSRSKAQMRAKSPARKSRPRGPASKRAHAKSSREKVRAYRERMRAQGLKLVQMWLPDTRTAEFAAEAHRQSRLANLSPFAAADQAWVDHLSDWTAE